MTQDDLDRLHAQVAAQIDRPLATCIPVLPGQLRELLRGYEVARAIESQVGKPT